MKMNSGSKVGLVLGGIGGIVGIIGLAAAYESTTEAMAPVGVMLLITTMFFALAGAFTKNGQWTPKGVTFFGFLTAAVVVGCTIANVVNYHIAAVEIVLAVLIIVVSYSPATKRFLNEN